MTSGRCALRVQFPFSHRRQTQMSRLHLHRHPLTFPTDRLGHRRHGRPNRGQRHNTRNTRMHGTGTTCRNTTRYNTGQSTSIGHRKLGQAYRCRQLKVTTTYRIRGIHSTQRQRRMRRRHRTGSGSRHRQRNTTRNGRPRWHHDLRCGHRGRYLRTGAHISPSTRSIQSRTRRTMNRGHNANFSHTRTRRLLGVEHRMTMRRVSQPRTGRGSRRTNSSTQLTRRPHLLTGNNELINLPDTQRGHRGHSTSRGNGNRHTMRNRIPVRHINRGLTSQDSGSRYRKGHAVCRQSNGQDLLQKRRLKSMHRTRNRRYTQSKTRSGTQSGRRLRIKHRHRSRITRRGSSTMTRRRLMTTRSPHTRHGRQHNSDMSRHRRTSRLTHNNGQSTRFHYRITFSTSSRRLKTTRQRSRRRRRHRTRLNTHKKRHNNN